MASRLRHLIFSLYDVDYIGEKEEDQDVLSSLGERWITAVSRPRNCNSCVARTPLATVSWPPPSHVV